MTVTLLPPIETEPETETEGARVARLTERCRKIEAENQADAREFLRVAMIRAHLAVSHNQPEPDWYPPRLLDDAIYDAFKDEHGHSEVDKMCTVWLDAARECGLEVEDEDEDLIPEVLDAITDAINRAIWYGLTVAYMRLGGSVSIPNHMAPPGGWMS